MALAFVGETANPPVTLTGTSATTQTCTRTFTGGNAVIAFCMGIGSATTVTFSDGVNTWTTDSTVLPLGGGFQCLATGHALNVAAGSTTVTATWNATVHHSFVILVEVSGAKTSGALEGKAGQYQGTPGTGADALTSGNPSPAPTTTANTIVVGFTCNFNNNVAPTAVGTGFTQTGAVKYTASMGGVQGEYKIVSATGTYPATFTSGVTNDNWTTCVVILAEASGGGGLTASGFESIAPDIRPRRRARGDSADGLVALNKSYVPPHAFDVKPRARRPIIESTEPRPTITGLPIISGLKLWLRGDLGVTLSAGNVVSWLDQSGNGNDVTGSILYNSSSINGKPGLTFSSAGMTNSASNILAGNSPRTIFVVCKSTGAVGSAITIRTGTLKADYPPGWSFGGNNLIYTDGVNNPNNASVASHSVTNVPMIAMWQSAGPGTTLAYKETGLSYVVTQPSGSSTDSGATGFTIGGSGAAVQAFAGDIDEVIVYDSALSAGNEAAVYGYLYARYFLPAAVQNDYQMRKWSLGPRASTGSDGLPSAQAPALASWFPDYAADRPRASHRPGSEMSIVHPGTVGAWIHVNDVVRLRRATRIHDSAGVPVQLQVIPIAAWAHVEQGSRSKHRNPEYQLVSVLPALPVSGPALQPPLWAVIDGVSLSIDVDIVHLSSAVDAVSLDLDGDT